MGATAIMGSDDSLAKEVNILGRRRVWHRDLGASYPADPPSVRRSYPPPLPLPGPRSYGRPRTGEIPDSAQRDALVSWLRQQSRTGILVLA